MFNKLAKSQITIGTSLKWVLIAQAVLAIFLILADVEGRWLPRFGDQSNLPSGPVSPGDQTRRYDPSQVRPDFSDRTNLPSINLSDDMPDRLEFEMIEAENIGPVLLINGPIEAGDSGRFSSYLESLSEVPEFIALNSPGGIVSEALTMGRRLNETEANTVMLPGMVCLSSCPYILAAGLERRVSRNAAVGLHQHYYDTPGYMPVFLAVEEIQYGQGQTLEYLIQMGVDPSLMLYSLNTPPEEIYLMVEDELLQTRLATEMNE